MYRMSDKAPNRIFISLVHCICIVWLGITRNLATLHGITRVGDRSAQTLTVWSLRYYLRGVGRWRWKICATVPLRRTW